MYSLEEYPLINVFIIGTSTKWYGLAKDINIVGISFTNQGASAAIKCTQSSLTVVWLLAVSTFAKYINKSYLDLSSFILPLNTSLKSSFFLSNKSTSNPKASNLALKL